MRQTKHAQPIGLQPGIYFKLSNEAYHLDPSLSHSGMTNLLVSWPDYWDRSCHNPNRRDYTQTEAMAFGERCHAYLLEENEFFNRFGVHGQKFDYKKHVPISSIEFSKIKKSIECIRRIPEADNHFKGGYPEVTIIWLDPLTKIMLRARIDYLRIFGAIDYKRIKGMDNFTIGRAVKDQGLDIQAFLYIEAIRHARIMLKGKNPNVVGDVDQDWILGFTHNKGEMFRFLFQRSTPPYIWSFRELAPEVIEEGERAVRTAITLYKKNIERYGVAEPPSGSAVVDEISSFHIPRRNYD